MKLRLERIYNCDKYCIGHLYVDDAYFCDTLEDIDRGLDSDMTEQEIMSIKVANKTAIPVGTYNINMSIVSPKFSKKQIYMDICKGKVPRLEGVKGYSGVLIHIGNTDKDSAGCILVGWNKVKGKVINSTIAFTNLYYKLKVAKDIGERITLTIKRKYIV